MSTILSEKKARHDMAAILIDTDCGHIMPPTYHAPVGPAEEAASDTVIVWTDSVSLAYLQCSPPNLSQLTVDAVFRGP